MSVGAMRVIHPGMLTTVQDWGRVGYAAMGVPEGGAADGLSMRIGNRLVGNRDGAPGLEMTLTGGVFEFESEAAVAVTGGECAVWIEGVGGAKKEMAGGAAVRVGAGERVRVGPIMRGVRAYLCVSGGVSASRVMGSASTHLGAGFGGFEGRALRVGDRVEIGEAAGMGERVLSDVAQAIAREVVERRVVRAVEGAHAERFDERALRAFWDSRWTVSPQCDRMGIRLTGRKVETKSGGRMTSEGMAWGSVQVPESGEPIVLMCDHPTTGGYPVIACVSTVDLPVLGQLRPGETVGFERIGQAEALELLRERERRLDVEVPRA